MATKAEIREEMRRRRAAVSPQERCAASRAACRAIAEREEVVRAFAAGLPVAVYIATEREIDLGPFVREALAAGAALAAPRWNGVEYEAAALSSVDELVPGPMGILEPPNSAPVVAPAVWIVPGLAFTADGRRLGYGGGWYDKMLSAAGDGVTALGVAYPFQIVDELPSESHDIVLNGIIATDGRYVGD